MNDCANRERAVQTRSMILILLAAACWGMIGVFSRALSAAGATPIQITAVRCVIVAALLTAFLLIKDRSLLRVRLRDLWMFFGTGICSFLFFNLCYFYTQSQTSLSAAAILLYTSPFFVMLISAAVFREKLTAAKIIALFVAFGGCVLITGVLGGGAKVPLIAIITGVGSGLGYGLYSIFGKLALRRYDILTVTAYTFIFAGVGAVPFSSPATLCGMIFSDGKLVLCALLLGVMCTLTPFVLYTKGLSGIDSGKAAVIAYAEPAVATLVGAAVFHEPITLAKTAGILLVLAAILILGYRGKHTDSSADRMEN